MKKLHLNRVSGWKNKEVLMNKNEIRLKNNLKKTAINCSKVLSLGKCYKICVIEEM